MKIYQIELTNACNLNCSYCPRSEAKRAIGFMSYTILNRILKVIENDRLELHHFGESLLDSEIANKIRLIKWKKPKLKLVLNTNGTLLTPEKCREIFEAGLDELYISYHIPESLKYIYLIDRELRDKIEILYITDDLTGALDPRLIIARDVGYSVVLKKMRDLGNRNSKTVLPGASKDRCSFIKNNEVVIQWDGAIVPCCEVFDKQCVLGSVMKESEVQNKAFSMCKTCVGYGNNDEETELVRL